MSLDQFRYKQYKSVYYIYYITFGRYIQRKSLGNAGRSGKVWTERVIWRASENVREPRRLSSRGFSHAEQPGQHHHTVSSSHPKQRAHRQLQRRQEKQHESVPVKS